MQKTEQKTEQQAGLGMSFCEEEGRITVFRKTLEALEWPSHYRFLYNRKMKQIAVQACGAEESDRRADVRALPDARRKGTERNRRSTCDRGAGAPGGDGGVQRRGKTAGGIAAGAGRSRGI